MDKPYRISQLQSGATLVITPKKELSSVNIAIFIKVGSQDEKVEEYGMTHFLEHMLFKGNRFIQSQLEISKDLDHMGSEYNAFTGKHVTCFHIHVAKKWATKAFTIFSNMILHSTLEKKKMEKEKMVVLEEFNHSIDDHTAYVIENAYQLMFENTVLGPPIIGNVPSIVSYTHTSLTKYYKKYYRKDNITLSICGNIPSTLLKKIYSVYGKPTRKKQILIKKTPPLEEKTHHPFDYGLPRKLNISII